MRVMTRNDVPKETFGIQTTHILNAINTGSILKHVWVIDYWLKIRYC